MDAIYGPFLSLLPREAHILDAGCGSGRDSLHFLRRGHSVIAFDASAKMASLASELLGQDVLRMSFDEVAFDQQFDGVWACASLLHVPRAALPDVLGRLGRSLKPGGTMYASFKHGYGEVIRDGRLFNDYEEEAFLALLRACPELSLIDLWQTNDVRPDREDAVWLNALIQRR